MQTHLFKQNSINASKNNLSSLSIYMTVAFVILTIAAIILIPGYSTLITGIVIIVTSVRHLIISINKKPLLLEITESKIVYLSEERNELVTINPEEIRTISHKFCELQIQTKDDTIHHVNILNTGSEQTRWEIKELTKRLTEKISA
ncbi:MAG: hypothetical protein H7Y07_14020 [Pyrinomonadaceae bacterium]|nr:hypothetical protein [Sphingobacteriaceae bacterium]